MDKFSHAEIISKNIRQLLKDKKITQRQLAKDLGITTVTINNYLTAKRIPDYEMVQKIADYLGVEKIEIDSSYQPTLSPTAARIANLASKLAEPRRKKVLNYVQNQLLEQIENIPEIHEDAPLYIIKPRHEVEVLSKVSAGFGYGFDDNDTTTVLTDRDDFPRHDLKTMITGDSMEPDYHAGDVLLLCDEGVTTNYSGQLSVVVVDDENYFKEIYTDDENNELILHSLNPKYDDKTISFPPSDGEYMKIFRVVDSFTPVAP